MSYQCKLCKGKKAFVTSSRGVIRDHARVIHGIKGKPLTGTGKTKYLPSEISESYKWVD